MTPDTNHARTKPNLPTRAATEQRAAQLRDFRPRPQRGPHTQPPTPDPEPPPPPIAAAEPPRAAQPEPSPIPELDEAALHGLAGRVVRTIAPHTEAHPAAILLQLLAAFGNVIGRGPHCMVGSARHALNLFVVLVGDSGKARKGSSWTEIARLFAEVDHPWLGTRVNSARLTPGSLLHALQHQQPPADPRLLVLSEEFVSVLHTLRRGNGQLSPLLRSAWDTGHLATLDKSQLLPPTGSHISLIAHITEHELAQNLPNAEAHNGFANRCLWASVQRSNCLPDGGNLDPQKLSVLAQELRGVLDWAAATPEILFQRDAAASRLWRHYYADLSQAQPDLRGAATSRAEAQVLRLSALYAALDSTSVIGLAHLSAAFAVWAHCYDSATHLFGLSTGNPVADRIYDTLKASPDGLRREQIRRLFNGHVRCDRIDAALQQLTVLGALVSRSEQTGGRPTTFWSAVEAQPPMEDNESVTEHYSDPASPERDG